MHVRRSVRVAARLGGVLLAACGPAVAPRPVPAPTPIPVVTPPPAIAVPVTYTLPSLVTDTRYRLESTTVLERDSAGRRESQQLVSSAEAIVRLRRTANGNFEGTGRLSGYAVQSPLSTTPIALDSLRFDVALDSLALRVVMQPPLANECDRPETGALALVRDVLWRVPTSLTVGDRWSDSTVQIVCRSSLPMVVRTTSVYEVTDSAGSDEGTLLVLTRTNQVRVEGKTTSPWRIVEVTGTGDGTLEARVAVRSGAVREVAGRSTLSLVVTDRTAPTIVRSQTVTQRVTTSAKAIGR